MGILYLALKLMARFIKPCLPLLLAFLLVQFSIVYSSSPPKPSLIPSSQPTADSPSPKSPSPISLPPFPSNAPVNSPHPYSPPAPPQSSPSQTPSPDDTPLAPSPALLNLSDVNHSNLNMNEDRAKNFSGGISLAKKARIILGVIIGVGVAMLELVVVRMLG